MALFESSNPTLTEKIFANSIDHSNSETMTVKGSIQKFGFLLLLVIAGAAYVWKLYYENKVPTMMTLFMVGIFGGLITGFIVSFKPNLARYLAPAYALLEGLAIGGLSAIINNQMKEKYPNLVLQAVLLTLGVALAMFLLYNFRIIKPTQKFKAIITSAIVGVFLLYAADMILSLFHVSIPFLEWNNSSPLAIGINLLIVVIASFSLILNFERIETGEKMGAPKQMEWYGAFGLLVTLVWLYVEILNLLSRINNSRN